MTSSTAIVAVMIFVVFTAALLTAREDVPRVDVNEAAREEMAVAPMAMPTIPPRTAPQPVEAAKEAPRSVAAKTSAEPEPQPAAVPANHAAPTLMSHAIEPQREKQASVTVTGCLENNEGTFVLTDTTGAAAPTSRSWRSGFLRKRPAQVELADGVGTLGLRSHVGRRVSATGTLVDREMRVDSLRALGACE